MSIQTVIHKNDCLLYPIPIPKRLRITHIPEYYAVSFVFLYCFCNSYVQRLLCVQNLSCNFLLFVGWRIDSFHLIKDSKALLLLISKLGVWQYLHPVIRLQSLDKLSRLLQICFVGCYARHKDMSNPHMLSLIGEILCQV